MARNQQTPGSADPPTVSGGRATSISDAQTGAILSAVEQQLTRYFGAMSARADAVQQASEAGRHELVVYFQQQIDSLQAELERSRQANEGYEQALQSAIEDRLTEFAASQHWRIGEIEQRLERVSDDISLGLPTQMEAATVPLQQRFDRTTEVLAARIEELQNAARRFDEQSSALVHHVNDATSNLSRRLDETGRNVAGHLDERTTALSQRVDEATSGMRQHVTDQVATFTRKIEDTENKIIDRALAMEERINEQTGVRLAGVEATIGRISSGIDDAIVALSHRVIELENLNNSLVGQIEALASKVDSVDQEAINNLREQMSSAIGESMLVRIELERVASSTGEQFDTLNVRVAELANEIAESTMDVSTAVQLERLEEIERALVELDPDQFVRRVDLDLAANSNTAADTYTDTDTKNSPGSGQQAVADGRSDSSPVADATPSESNLSSW